MRQPLTPKNQKKRLPNQNELYATIVICTYTIERYDDLSEAILSTRDQTVPPKEVIVVVDHNEELLHRLQIEYPHEIVTPNQMKRGLSGSRNTGVNLATGNVILFLDDDAIAAPDLVERHLSLYSDSNVLGVGSMVDPLWLSGRPVWFPEEYDWVVGCSYRGGPQTLQPVNKVVGCSCSFRREVFEEIGGFSLLLGRIGNILLSGEESEICFRIKKQWDDAIILFDPEAKTQHKVPASRSNWRYFRTRCFYGGVSNFVLVRFTGTEIGLSSERQFVRRTLVDGLIRYISEGFRERSSFGFKKAGALFLGFIFTFAGYLWGAIYSTVSRGDFENKIYGQES